MHRAKPRAKARRPAVSPRRPLAIALVLLSFGPLLPALPAAADPWRVHRGPTGERRGDVVGALMAAPEDPQRASRLRGQLSPAQLDRALRVLADRAGRSPPHYPALMAHGQLLLASGREAEALLSFSRAAELRPGRPAPLLATAQAMVRLGRGAEGGRLLESAADQPGSARQQRASLLVEAAELGEAAGDEAATDRRLRAGLDAVLGATARGEKAIPGALPTLARLCQVAVRRGQGSPCADRMAAYASTMPGERRSALRAEAELREALGDHQRALAAWQAIVRLTGGQGDRADGPAARALALMDLLGQGPQIEAMVAGLAAQGARNLGAMLAAVERAYQRGDKELGGRLFDQARRGLSRSPAGLSRLADLASRFNEPARVEACWQAVLALDARDERAIMALGEAHFQGGRRELARETWRRLERVIRPPASAHARLAELFGDHDMLPEAVAEARKAQRLDRDDLSHHRTLARILERKRDNPGAISEWRAVLAGARPGARDRRPPGSGAAREDGEEQGLRKEARLRLVALLGREGRERLRAETVLLKDRARRHPEERETALYLAELQLRLAQPGEAVETLTATVEARPQDAEIVLLLVQLLRQSKQTIRALERLERFVQDVPERAAETWLRIASLRAERYEDQPAMAAVARAVGLAAGDPEILVRGAELAESLGAVGAAATHYRAALAVQPSAKAMAGVARLQALRGEAAVAARELAFPARQSGSRSESRSESQSESMERLLPLMSYLGTPGALLVPAATGATADRGRRMDRPLLEALATTGPGRSTLCCSTPAAICRARWWRWRHWACWATPTR